MDYAIVGRLADDGCTAETVAFHADGRHLANISYALEGTPCRHVYEQAAIKCFQCDVQREFPDDLDLVELEAESYLGIPILDESGRAVGHIALLDRHEIPRPSRSEEMILKIFAARTAAEFRHIEAQAQLEAAREAADRANQAKTKFLANISHELRTPLNAVLGFAQLLEMDQAITTDQTQLVAGINRNGEHLMVLISNILDMSRIELGQIRLSLADVQIADLRDDLWSLISPLATQRDVRFQIEVSPDVPSVLTIDRSAVRQVIVNLANNALRAISEAGRFEGQLNIRIGNETSEAQSQLVFEVTDNGCGISSDDVGRIFEPFERGHSTTGGTGLGLAIAQSLTTAMTGRLQVDSEVGSGTTFRFCLPYESDAVSGSVGNADAGQASGRGILVVDDTSSSRDVLRRALELHGFEVAEAQDGFDGVEQAAALQPDLILMDIRMPRMDGIESTLKIRELHGENAPPIVAVTGNLLAADGQPSDLSVFDDTLGKPFRIPVLIEKVEALLETRRHAG